MLKKSCESLEISWKEIDSRIFNSLINEWYKVYDMSTYAYGMYRMEFHNAIRQKKKPVG